MPDQNITDRLIPVHVIETIVRARAGTRLWFAFGPDMALDVAAQLVPDPEFLTVASVGSRRLIFNSEGQPCMIPRAGHTVYGTIWQIADAAMAGLDIRLAVPSATHRNGVLARSPTGKPILAEYHTPRLQRASKVSPDVLAPIIAVATQLEFPPLYLDQLAQWGLR